MTKKEFFDYLVRQGCIPQPIAPYKANVIYFNNPSNSCQAYLDLPIDDSTIYAFYIFRVCSILRVPAPSFTQHLNGLNNKINDRLSEN
jgi:hypothetical protein